MDDASAQLSEIAQRLADLAAAAKQLSEQPLLQFDAAELAKPENQEQLIASTVHETPPRPVSH